MASLVPIDGATAALNGGDIDTAAEVSVGVQTPRRVSRVHNAFVGVADEVDADHSLTGHHGTRAVGRAVPGSAEMTNPPAGTRPVTGSA
jgi:hypothetical protein